MTIPFHRRARTWDGAWPSPTDVKSARARAVVVASCIAMHEAPAQAPTAVPSIAARSCHAMTFAPALGGVVTIGGARACGIDVLPDSSLWVWNGAHWRAIGEPLPKRLEDALLAWDSRSGTLVLHGGRSAGSVFRETLEWSTGRWRSRGAPGDVGPGALEHAAAAYDERRGRLVVFGGGSRDGRMFDTTWDWDGTEWRRHAGGPAPRVGHSMTWSPADSAVLLYGGFNAAGLLTDLWKRDGAGWTRLDSAGPARTEGPALVATESGVLLVGPRGASSKLGLWRWRAGRWTELDVEGPTPEVRVGQGLAYDAARRRVVLFGGYFPETDRTSAETWELDGRAWRLVSGGAR